MPQAELLTRAATIQPQTFDPANRTVRVVWSTGAAVPRRDHHGPYSEVLSLDPAHVRLDHLQGASVLDTHQQRDLRNVLGVVKQAGLEAGTGWADVQFSSRADVQPMVQDVADGVIRHVSVGYSVQQWQDGKHPTTGARTRTAIAWTPREISFVPLPADPGATVRNRPVSETVNEDDAGQRAELNQQIRSIASVSGLDATFANGLIDRGATIEQARAAAFDELVRRGGGAIRTQRVDAGDGTSEADAIRGRMEEALTCRILPSQKPSDAARPYMGLSLVDMARSLLQARGEAVSTMSREAIVQRAMHTTSDFPNLLTGTGNRVLMAAYQAAPNPVKQLARQSTVDDFRPKSLLKLSDLGPLAKVNEHGEIKSTSRSESREGYSLNTFATIFSLSRKAIINDDLGAFSDWSIAMGRAAAETEAGQLVALLTAASGTGPTMGDGKALFHTAHGNLASSGGAITTAALNAARMAMRVQTGVDGKTPINASPAFLLVAPDRETEAEQFLTLIYAATAGTANPFQGKLTLLVEPRLPAGAWYVFADPAVLPVIEYAYLSRAQGPQMASRDGWDVLGTEFRVVLDFGCGAIDWRGTYRNAGA